MRLSIGELWGDERWGAPGVRRFPTQKLEPDRRLILPPDVAREPALTADKLPPTTTPAVSSPSSPLYCLS